MELHRIVLKQNVKRFLLLGVSLALVALSNLRGEVNWDSERLNLEIRMQQRVEEALSKILPSGQYVVVVRIEPWPVSTDNSASSTKEDDFYLPGVPAKKNF